MRTADFDYNLPPGLIAQEPLRHRDQSRMLVLHRNTGRVEHRDFRELLEFLQAGDVFVLNNSRVIPARLRGVNARTGGAFEMLLLEENATNDWWAMLRPGKRARIGTEIRIISRSSRSRETSEAKTFCLASPIHAAVVETNDEGHRRLRFDGVSNILDALEEFGEVPLPPYIRRDGPEKRATRVPDSSPENGTRATRPSELIDDKSRYQTVFARTAGSVAAPTAGFHFTERFLDKIRARGVDIQFVTLHVGLGTFAPVKVETLAAHIMHEERFEVTEAAARAVNEAKTAGRRVIAVGITTVRVLETLAAQHAGRLVPGPGRTKIFIHPPHHFGIVDALLTNFHLPCSTLLMLVSAFAMPRVTRGRDLVLSAYAEAIRERYRFFSYGDAMLIL